MDMFNSFPSLGHAILSIFLALLCLAFSAFAKGRLLTACNVGFWLFLIITAIIWYLWVYNANVDARVRQDYSMASWMKEFGALTHEEQEVVASRYPHIRLSIKGGEFVKEFESTKVLVHLWTEFLNTSTPSYTSSKRDWNSKEKPLAAYEAMYAWLVKEEFVYDDSADGSHSYMWVGESYNYLYAKWHMADRKLVDMNAQEAKLAARVAKRYDEQQHDEFEEAV